MMNKSYLMLAPFIQEYIYKNKWEKLRDIQINAIHAILETDKNVLLSSQTASGKTEAAFLPILTDLINNKVQGVGVLYISPLKALINDQFHRLSDLLKEVDITVTRWHGDVSYNKKMKLLKDPEGIVQITPESLEAFVMKRRTDCIRLFSNLKYIIIDEVHYFMNSVRGIQLLSILERIARLTSNVPRRVGLSATLSDYKGSCEWLVSGTNKGCVVPKTGDERKVVRLLVEHFYSNVENEKKETEEFNPYFEYIYDISLNKKCIIFSNAKKDVEITIGYLKKIAENKKTPDNFLVHHGNISASLREYTEAKMKENESKIITGATVTLELGIDIGELERIIQTGSPLSVTSFVQRLGRCGRTGQPSEMVFVFNEEKIKEDVEFYRLINFEFLMSIAIIELYIKEKWIEPIKLKKYPFGILLHQTLSHLLTVGEISSAALASFMLTISPFKNIVIDDFKALLNKMVNDKLIEKIDNDNLIIGLIGESLVNNYEFYAVFDADIVYSVKYNSQEIGSISEPYPIGTAFALAGNTWEVREINHRQRIIYVNKLKGLSNISWAGKGTINIHTKILKKINDILNNEVEYSYLSVKALERLRECRKVAQISKMSTNRIIKMSANTYAIFPWLGTSSLIALKYSLFPYVDSVEYIYQAYLPLGLIVKVDKDLFYLDSILNYLIKANIDVSTFKILDSDCYVMNGKFNEYIPLELLKKQYCDEFIDIIDMQNNL